MKFGVIIQARMSSSRLPGKAILPLMGMPIIQLLLKRLKTAKLVDTIVLATSDRPDDDVIADIAEKERVGLFRGSLEDVLGRYVKAGRKYDFDYGIRITGDEPFLDGPTVDYIINKATEIKNFDLIDTRDNFTPGLRCEIYPKKLLEEIDCSLNPTKEEREHVTYYIHKKEKINNYKIIQLEAPKDLNLKELFFIIDTKDDYNYMLKLTEGVTDIFTTPQDFIKKHLKLKGLTI